MALKIVEDHRGDEFLNDLDDKYLSCRSQRHSFPKLIPGRRLPRGVSVSTSRNGASQMTYTCPDCTTVRTLTLMEDRILPVMGRHYAYKHPKGYLAPKGSGITKHDAVEELYRRVAPQIKAATADYIDPGSADLMGSLL